ncbi:MAG: AAA family ATPase [Nanoarchaeota archaeon]|nr:AAA family ATPase [Nanoarchaeota archaeon]
MGKIVGVLSLKGGVGKTSSVISLGQSLADVGKKVLLVDCNFSAPNLGFHLNILDPEKTIHNVLERSANLRDSIHKMEGFDVIPATHFKEPRINPLKLKDYLKPLKRSYDVILLDSSPSLDDETLSVILASDELLVVTTPDYPTLGTTIKAVNRAKQRGTPVIGVVLNKVYNKDFEIGMKDIENTLEVPILAVIPHDVNILKAVSKFEPWPKYSPKSRSVVEYRKLAGVLVGEKYEDKNFMGFFRKVTPKKQDVNREIYYESVFR